MGLWIVLILYFKIVCRLAKYMMIRGLTAFLIQSYSEVY